MTTKVHALVDALGNPVAFSLTPGQASDLSQAEPLLENVAPEAFLADKAYDADRLIQALKARGIKPVIPPKANRLVQRHCDFALYCERNLVEQFFINKNTLYCSFCGKSQHEVRKLIAGPTVFICDECVELCMDIIREENKSSLVKSKDGVPSPQEIRKVLDDYAFIPVFCGSAFKNKGVQPLLDAVVHYLPSPVDREAIKGVDVDTGEELDRKPVDLRALLDARVQDHGRSLCRHDHLRPRLFGQDRLRATVLNSTKEKKERIGRMLLMHANNREDIKEAFAGDIVALAGLKDTRTGDTLCDMQKPVILVGDGIPGSGH